MEVVILTGMSGAGKTNAVNWFEDRGYYCIDNMPPALIANFLDLTMASRKKIEKAAFVVDTRGGEFFDATKECISSLKRREDLDCRVLFIEAAARALVRRFNETRRSHPLAENDTPVTREVIALERDKLREIRDMSDYIIDTTSLKAPGLKAEIERLFGEGGRNSFAFNIQSFGYKNGLPGEVDAIMDCRCLPNPYYVPSLKKLTGKNKKVSNYVMRQPVADDFFRTALDQLEAIVPGYIREGKYHLNLAFGCTGGHHRSVAMAIRVAQALRDKGYRVTLEHRDL
ncbi:MAG: RNase adapter RapZ [Eubacterium sp.]|nr:RNase adapter RapZ [Eubacterium sp.]